MKPTSGQMNVFRKQWKKDNPPDKDGNYECWICKQPVTAEKMTIDHVAPVSQYPEYARDPSNIRPAHRFCNEQRSVTPLARTIRRFGKGRRRKLTGLI